MPTVAGIAAKFSTTAAARNFARIGEILGIDWFQYYDYPEGGRADHEDYDFGLVDIDDVPYAEATAALADANRLVPEIHAASARHAAPDSGYALPHAAISLDDHSLTRIGLPAESFSRPSQ